MKVRVTRIICVVFSGVFVTAFVVSSPWGTGMSFSVCQLGLTGYFYRLLGGVQFRVVLVSFTRDPLWLEIFVVRHFGRVVHVAYRGG